MNMNFEKKLPIPMEVKKAYPLSEAGAKIKEKRDEEIKKIFRGESKKIVLIVGPCSAEAKEPVLKYLEKLKTVADEVYGKIIIIPRVYTNKPRTTGEGYKGMLHNPVPEEHADLFKGIVATRDLHMSALNDYGFSCADELLYPDSYRYLSDILSYVAVGARSVENQQHRLTASGLDIPVGMKNPTGGDLTVMMNAIYASHNKHTFIYRGWQVTSEGNPYTHAILRGYTDFGGHDISNYHYENLVHLIELYRESGLKYPAAIIDASHANSGKNHLEQIRIAKDIIYSRNHNSGIKNLVKGIMIESYLEDGAGTLSSHKFGQSITDPCLGWEKTEKLIYDIADTLE